MTATKKRNFVHVPFDAVTCAAVPGFDSGDCKKKGSIPGVKRHVKKVHGVTAFKNADFPPIRQTERKPVTDMTVEELKGLAKERGLTGYSSMKRPELEKVLQS